jgi:hypothetical protein
MSENIDINVGIIKEEISINAANNIVEVNISTAPVIIINPQDYDLSQFTNTSPNPFVQQSSLASYVPISRNITINGVTQNLTTDRSWTISTGITIGATAITSGTVGRVLFEGTGNVVQESAGLTWDDTIGLLTIKQKNQTDGLRIENQANSALFFESYVLNAGAARHEASGSHVFRANGRDSLEIRDTYVEIKPSAFTRFFANNTEVVRIATTTGNLLLNTTTDAGYRLDVNGTARVSGILSLSSATGGYAYLQDTSLNSAYNVISLQNTSGAFAIISRTSTGGYVADHYGIVQTSAASSYQRWFTSGVERMRMDATGNVGIGTSSPAYPLHITRNSSSNYIQLSGNSNKGLFAEGSGLIAFDTSGNFNVYTGGVNLRATISSGGNVLIGTTTDAGYKLDVNGTARVQGKLVVDAGTPTVGVAKFTGIGGAVYTDFAVTGTGVNTFRIYPHSSGNTYLQHDGKVIFTPLGSTTGEMTIDTTGNVGIGTTSPATRLHVSKTDLSNELVTVRTQNNLSYADFGIQSGYARILLGGNILYAGSDSATYFYNGGNIVMTMNYLGNVGIGTSSPVVKYHQSQTQGIFARYDITNANADQNRGVFEFYTNTAVTPDFFGRFGFKFEGGINNASRQFQLHVGDNTTPRFVVNGSGNVLIGTTTDAGFKLDVNGTARVQGQTSIAPPSVTGALTTPSLDIAQTWNTTGLPTGISLTITDTASNANSNLMQLRVGANNIFTVRKNGIISFGPTGGAQIRTTQGGEFDLRSEASGASNDYRLQNGAVGSRNHTSGTASMIYSNIGFVPTSGNGNYSIFTYAGTINQTGGANGITRGLYIAPILTAAADFRAIETTVGNVLLGTTSGNVGIGTTSPGAKLNVEGRVDFSNDLRLRGTDSSANQGVSRFYVDSSNKLFIDTANDGSNLFVIDSSGNVGIGTTSPTEKLTVAGAIMVPSGGGAWGTSSGGVQLNYNNFIGQGHLTTYYDSTSLVLGAGVSQKTGITINGQTNAGGNNIFFRVGNSERMRLFSTGNFAINTTTDAGFKLDVNGTARVTGTGTGTANSFVVQNSASVQTFRVNDLGQVQIGRTTAINWTFSSNNLTSSQYAYILSSNGSVLSTSGNGGVLGNDTGAKICDQGVGVSNQLASAVLECNSTTRGFLPPRMTTTQKNAIASPATGLVVYDTDLNALCTYNGTTWITLGSGGGASSSSGIHVLTKPITGFYYSQITITGTSVLGGGAFQQNGSLQLFPFVPANTLTCDLMQFEIVTAAASALSKIAIYSDVAGKPSAKLYESPDTDSSTTGYKTVTTSFTFTGGTTYWIGLVSNSSSIQPRAIPSANFQPLVYQNGTNQSYNGWYISAAYGSLPATTTVTSTNVNMSSVPYISFRQA